MGSPDPYSRQLNGMGGGQSTQSKVAVVSRSQVPGVHVDYLFIQVPMDGGELDYSGNCGNMASGVGPFAVDEGLIYPKSAELHDITVRIRNVNTNRIIHSTFTVQGGIPVEDGPLRLDGVASPGSPIRLDFVDPAGSMTGQLLPTGAPIDTVSIAVPEGKTLSNPNTIVAQERDYVVSCVDAANPVVFVTASSLGLRGDESIAELAAAITPTLLAIRAAGAVKMGLTKTIEGAVLVGGTPKIAVVGAPVEYLTTDGRVITNSSYDIWVRAFSMGRPHSAIQMTGAVCVCAASAIPGTIVHGIVTRVRAERGTDSAETIAIGHANGIMAIEGDAEVTSGGQVVVRSSSVYRTARRLMEGKVLYLDSA